MYCEARTGTNSREGHSPDADDPHGQGDTPIEANQEEFDWVALHRATVGFARVWCKRQDEALDIAQEAMMALFHRSRNVQRPLPYLFVVTRRAATRLARREALPPNRKSGRGSRKAAHFRVIRYLKSQRDQKL